MNRLEKVLVASVVLNFILILFSFWFFVGTSGWTELAETCVDGYGQCIDDYRQCTDLVVECTDLAVEWEQAYDDLYYACIGERYYASSIEEGGRDSVDEKAIESDLSPMLNLNSSLPFPLMVI